MRLVPTPGSSGAPFPRMRLYFFLSIYFFPMENLSKKISLATIRRFQSKVHLAFFQVALTPIQLAGH